MTGRNQTAIFLIVWVALAIAWDIRVMWRVRRGRHHLQDHP